MNCFHTLHPPSLYHIPLPPPRLRVLHYLPQPAAVYIDRFNIIIIDCVPSKAKLYNPQLIPNL